MSSSEAETEDISSDEELATGLSDGRLKPGLNIPITRVRNLANDVNGLKQKLLEFAHKLNDNWPEILTATNEEANLGPELIAKLHSLKDKGAVFNDFQRETAFYTQAQAACLQIIPKLHAAGIKTKRPSDYFAEMVKTDEHMQRVRRHLLRRKDAKQRSERIRQLRAHKKQAKQLQNQLKVQRQEQKRATVMELKSLKNRTKQINTPPVNKKRTVRNQKYGRGGKKKGLKRNTHDSTVNFTSHNKRPGKQRRVQMRNKQKHTKKRK